MNINRLLIILGLLLPTFGIAQILDDSTKQVYGPFSTGFFFEGNVMDDDTLLQHPDTLIDGFRFMTLNKQNGWLWQDLGNEGTAAKPFFLQTPDNAFTETGFTSFSNFYAPKISQIRYYNTRSPFTNMAYTQSTNGLGNLEFTHSQNIKDNWNIALDAHRISSSKQYSAKNSEDKLVSHWDMVLNSNYSTKNKKYTFLGSYIHFNHQQLDQGGIKPLDGAEFQTPSQLGSDFNTRYQQLLSGVESSERWNNIHVYHQYQLSKGIQIFHTVDYQRQKYFHSDTLISTNNVYGIYADTVSNEKMKTYYFYENVQNRVGFKGFYKGFKYNVGLTNRIYSFNNVRNSETGNKKTEVLIGGTAGYWFPDSSNYLSTDLYIGFGNSPNVYLNSKLNFKGFNLGFKFITKPAYMFNQNFQSEVALWQNNFGNVTHTEASGNYLFKGKKAYFEPGVRINLVSNHLYFDQNQTPQQLESEAVFFNLNLKAGIILKNFKFSNRLIFATTSNSDVFRIPSFVNNTNAEFHLFYAKVLHLYVGTDVYYRSSFLADAYSPLLRGFYLQDNQSVWGNPVVDVYTNFMIKRVKLAFSYNFINQGLPYNGFYTTPNYLAMARTFFIKVNWPLFD
jgi:hypothetical protein